MSAPVKVSASTVGNDGKVGQAFKLHNVKRAECLRFTQRVQQNKFEKNKKRLDLNQMKQTAKDTLCTSDQT